MSAGNREALARRTEAFGVLVLALSVRAPFLPTGALAAALVGRGAGYRPTRFSLALMTSVFLSALACTPVYAFALHDLQSRIVAWAVAGVAGVISLVATYAARRRSRRA